MSKIIVFGSVLQDIFLTLSPQDLVHSNEKELVFQIGKKHHIESIHNAMGGGGANMAVALSRLENDVRFHAAVGDDETGALLVSQLEREKIDISLVQETSKKTGFSIIFPSRSGNQTIFSYTGAHLELDSFLYDTNDVDAFCIAPLHGTAVKNIAKVLQSKPEQSIVFVNPSVDQIVDAEKTLYHSLPSVDIVQCNYREALLFLQHIVEKKRDQAPLSSTSGKELDYFFKTMHERGVLIVIVTRGKEGVSISHHGTKYDLKMPIVAVKNTVGAGDAFGSTFLHGWLQTKSIEKSIAMAAANVVFVLQSFDAQAGLLSYDAMRHTIDNVSNCIDIKKTG